MSTREAAPVSIVIPTLNAARRLPQALAGLAQAAIDGVVAEVVVSDGGSDDDTIAIAEAAGAKVVAGEKGRGAQLARGADAARGAWLLFLHADTVLERSWPDEARDVMRDENSVGVFTLAFDAKGAAPRMVAAGANLRTRILGSPYGDQGLLISRNLYDRIGGYSRTPLFEDVDIIDRILREKGRRALRIMKARAVTSADRYERDGYFGRVAKNLIWIALYRAGVAPEKIARIYAK